MRYFKSILLLICIFSINNIAWAQTIYPKGTYMNIEEIITKSPSQNYNIQINVNMKSGDAKVKALDKSITKKTMKEEIWAISDGQNLIINTDIFEYKSSYVPVLAEGKYITFKATEKVDPNAATMMLTGPLAGGGSKTSMYVIDTKDGVVYRLDKEVLDEFLTQFPDLQSQYENEKNHKNLEVQLNYIRELNSRHGK